MIMKTLVLAFTLITFTLFSARANIDCIWSTSKAGITIHFVSSCNMLDSRFIDSFLNKIVKKLGRSAKSRNILIVINEHSLSFPKNELNNFISVGFDTLRMIDDNFIFDYYRSKEDSAIGPDGGLNTYKSETNPLDINATNKKSTNKLGIKIIYDSDYGMTKLKWQEVEKLVLYASANEEYIKKTQTKQVIRYNTNGWYVTIKNIDTRTIEALLHRRLIKKKPEPSFVSTLITNIRATFWAYIILSLLNLLIWFNLFS